MQADLEQIYKEYKLSRDSIQLVEVLVTKCSAELNDDLNNMTSGEYTPVNLKINHGCDWTSNSTAKGYLKAEVSVLTEEDGQTIAKFSINVVGLFEITSDEEINESEYTRRLELQLVPQLLPYVRSTLTTLSALLSMQPVVLPTMDIMRSIQKNRQSK